MKSSYEKCHVSFIYSYAARVISSANDNDAIIEASSHWQRSLTSQIVKYMLFTYVICDGREIALLTIDFNSFSSVCIIYEMKCNGGLDKQRAAELVREEKKPMKKWVFKPRHWGDVDCVLSTHSWFDWLAIVCGEYFHNFFSSPLFLYRLLVPILHHIIMHARKRANVFSAVCPFKRAEEAKTTMIRAMMMMMREHRSDEAILRMKISWKSRSRAFKSLLLGCRCSFSTTIDVMAPHIHIQCADLSFRATGLPLGKNYQIFHMISFMDLLSREKIASVQASVRW